MFTDPEGLYYWAHASTELGDHDRALNLLEKAVSTGLHSVSALESTPTFEPLRSTPRFRQLVENARARQAEAERTFADADGPRLLGLK
jgi:hypothetical protein